MDTTQCLRNRLDCALANLSTRTREREAARNERDFRTQELISARQEIVRLQVDRERIRNERDLAEVRMIDAEAMLADAREVTVTLRFVG